MVVGEQLGGDDAVLIVEVIRSAGGVELLNDGDVSMNGLQVIGRESHRITAKWLFVIKITLC